MTKENFHTISSFLMSSCFCLFHSVASLQCSSASEQLENASQSRIYLSGTVMDCLMHCDRSCFDLCSCIYYAYEDKPICNHQGWCKNVYHNNILKQFTIKHWRSLYVFYINFTSTQPLLSCTGKDKIVLFQAFLC